MTAYYRRMILVAACAALLLAFTGCSLRTAPPPPGAAAAPPPTDAPASPLPGDARPDPRMLAAANLLEEGKRYLEHGRPDPALAMLERALALHPGNGQVYYYMAEAWILKRNQPQALEFNRLAGIYLRGEKAWRTRVREQATRIGELW